METENCTKDLSSSSSAGRIKKVQFSSDSFKVEDDEICDSLNCINLGEQQHQHLENNHQLENNCNNSASANLRLILNNNNIKMSNNERPSFLSD
uniref:Uncharacterized protein n=1 Tax=Stomoxys calcitrans TaxID=35570 RepID=A0A1I8Q833_STOCA